MSPGAAHTRGGLDDTMATGSWAGGSELPDPVHFVCPDDRVWPELRDGAAAEIDGATLSKRAVGTMNNWVLRTCDQLRRAGLPATLAAEQRADAVNIVYVRDFGRRARRRDAFAVVPLSDAHYTMLADFRIFQNGLWRAGNKGWTIWHWPQPATMPRDPGRGDRVERLVYKGRLANPDPAFRSETFRARLAELGVELVTDGFFSGVGGHQDWSDYTTADLVLAVRSLTPYDARKKPASKLVNAWFAGVPAILGPEPVFREQRRSAEDFIEVRAPGEALDAVARLRESPELYRVMVRNGRARSAEFTEARLKRMWRDALAGPISTAFRAWQCRPAPVRAAGVLWGLATEAPMRRIDRWCVRNGVRILTGNQTGMAAPLDQAAPAAK